MNILKLLDEKIEVFLITASMIIITVLMTSQIISRKLLNFAIPWCEEFCVHLFILVAFAGISYSIKTNSAIRFDIILSFTSTKARKWFDLISNLIVGIFFISLIPSMIPTIKGVSNVKATVMPYYMSVVYGAAMLCLLLGTIRAFQKSFYNLMLIIHSSEGERGQTRK